MPKEVRQLELGGPFGTFIANQSKAIESLTTESPIIPNNQLELGDGFTLEKPERRVEILGQSKAVKSTTFKPSILSERRLVFNEEVIVDSFHKLLPHLHRIPRGQEIKVAFKTGGYGWVKLQKPVYVIFLQASGKNKQWELKVPAVVKHPRHNTVWAYGLKDTLDPDTLAKIKRFTYPKITYNRRGRRKAEEQDLSEFINIWREISAKKMVN